MLEVKRQIQRVNGVIQETALQDAQCLPEDTVVGGSGGDSQDVQRTAEGKERVYHTDGRSPPLGRFFHCVVYCQQREQPKTTDKQKRPETA